MKLIELRLGCLLLESQFLRTKYWVKGKMALLRQLVLFWEEDGLTAQKLTPLTSSLLLIRGKSF